jgi:hypothetical protein
VDADRPFGLRRIVEQIQAVDPGRLRGVALFATAGTTNAVMKAENPMRDDWRDLEAVRAKAAASGLPPVMALAVGSDSIGVYAMTPQGELRGGLFARWNVGDFRAGSHRGFIVVALTVILREGDRFDHSGPRYELETKSFPLGPNRFNSRVARMIVQMGQPTPRSGP